MYALFKQLDVDGSKKVCWNEWLTGLRHRIRGVGERQLRQAFKQIDMNNDNFLSWEEVKQRLQYFAKKNNRQTVNECLSDLVLSCVATRQAGKLVGEERTNRLRREQIRKLRQECDEIGQYNKDVSQSLHLSYQLPSKTRGFTPGGATPGATPGGPRETYGRDNVRETEGRSRQTSRRRRADEDSRFAQIDDMYNRVNDTRESNSRQERELQYFRKLRKKLKSQKRNINDILTNYNCEAEQIVTEADDDSVYTGNGNGTGGPGLNITNVDYERKVITLQNTAKVQVQAGSYYLVAGRARFQLPTRSLWPIGHHHDKLEVGLGGNKDRYGTELFWPNVIGPMLASSELQLMTFGNKVGRGIPGHKLAREVPRTRSFGGGALSVTSEAAPEVNDRVKIRTTIGIDTDDEPIYRWVHGIVLEVHADCEKALVAWTCREQGRKRIQSKKWSDLVVET